MISFPPIPDAEHRENAELSSAHVPIRYEDVSQDGRLVLEAFPNSIGEACWRAILAKHPLAAGMRGTGVVPILTRMVSQGMPGPISVNADLVAHGAVQLAHAVSRSGEVERIHLNMWAELTAPLGRTYGPPPERAGERAVVGRIFAEHVFTRLFAPAAERRVTRLEIPGLPPVPAARYDATPPASLLDIPQGAEPLDHALDVDATPIAFGICHTDSNQHVNSLVYPRLFEEAALRRFATLGRGTAVLAREMEIVFRKPAFAGEKLRIGLRTFEQAGRLGAAGAFVGDEDAASAESLAMSRPRCFVRMSFES